MYKLWELMVEVKCKRNQKKKILYNLNKNVKL